MPSEQAIERLRKSNEERKQQLYNRGLESGKLWAETIAEADELIRLERLLTTGRSEWDCQLEGEGMAYSAAESLYFEINPENDGSRQASRDFWFANAGDGNARVIDEADFTRGFADGALQTWEEIKPSLA